MPPRRLFDIAAGDAAEQQPAIAGGGRPNTRLGRHPAGTAATGARANSPSEIPARGWFEIGKRVVARFGRDRVMAEAAGVTFYALLAIFPAIASLISLYGLVADPATIGTHLSLAAGVIPQGGMQIIADQVKSLTSSPHQALGFGALIGIATSLWSANAGMKSLFDALNVVYEEKETRSFIRFTLVAFAFTMGALIFVILALSAVVALPAVLTFVGLGSTTDTLLSLARWPLMLLAIAFLLAFIYRYGPDRAKARWRWLTWGSGFASLTWILASAGFSWYVANFGSYNKTYGSLGAAVGFMTWIWISTMIVLIGAELNAEMEHQTAMPTTEPG
jgi:membrane protein